MPTVAASLQTAIRTLCNHSDSPRLDAEVLLCTVLGISRAALVVHGAATVTGDHLRAYQSLLERRIAGAPVPYLTGTREFWSLELSVTPDVLVPRPETELLVELALTMLPADRPCAVLDLGTGSGAIALAIASERPLARVIGVDVSAPALAVAMHNARRLRLLSVEWRRGSWFDALPQDARFDLIVANPPYVAAADPALASLSHEPLLALSSGATGLDALGAIVAGAAAHLHAGGRLMLEHGATQADAVTVMLRERGFLGVRTYADYSNHPRVSGGIASSGSPYNLHSSPIHPLQGNSMIHFETTLGDFKIEFFDKEAPISVANFKKYVDEAFFDGTIFHRIVPGFVIQGGGFTEDMSQKKTNPAIKNEADNGLKNSRGTLSMARTNDVNSATSQFFVNLKDNDFLDHSRGNFGYAVFARVTEGMDVIDKIAAVETARKRGFDDVPVEAVIMKSVRHTDKES